MWLSQLALINFRNFAQLRLELQPGVLLFCGQNGQGKTNLLESVYVLATTRSPRTSSERELLSWRAPDDPDLAAVVAPFARLEAYVRRLEGEVHLELTFEGERTSVSASRPGGGYSRSTNAPGTSDGGADSNSGRSLEPPPISRPGSGSGSASGSSSTGRSASPPGPTPDHSSWPPSGRTPDRSSASSPGPTPSRDSASASGSSSTGSSASPPGLSPGPGPGRGAGAAGATGAVTRGIKVNGLATRATGLVGQLPVVYFSPIDVELAGGPPAGRRQYLNLANSQVSADHLRALQRYNRVLLQRNQVLRLVRERRQPPGALEPWTEQMLDWGARILHQRLAMLRDVDARLARIFSDLAGTNGTLRVVYRSTAFDPDGGDFTVDALRAAFRERQSHLAQRETDQSVSLVGPHRDDFTFMLDDVDLNTYGSRGQQRLAVLALKLAEADWMRSAIGELPVVLLDDVLSELDPQRRAYVLQRVAEPEPTHQRQVWITTTETDPSPVHELLRCAQRFVIDAGRVRTA